jgi:plasmid stabilization system protein ParE
MPLRVKLRPQARADFAAIVRFITNQNQDSGVANQVGRKILQRCAVAANAPGAGAPFPGRAGVRKLLEGPYQIYYAVEEGEIVILRIWDGRRGTDPRV